MARKKTDAAEAAPADGKNVVVIPPPNFAIAEFEIVGISELLQHKFSEKAQRLIEEAQEAGGKSKNKKVREPKDFHALFLAARHISAEGWYGHPAAAFRSAMVDACRVTGFKMTIAKLCIFVLADGYDSESGTPLVRLKAGEPTMTKMPVRLKPSGVIDIRARPMWREWGATLRVRYDADQFSLSDITNLCHRAGLQCGIGEGRPSSPASDGQGWGRWTLATEGAQTK